MSVFYKYIIHVVIFFKCNINIKRDGFLSECSPQAHNACSSSNMSIKEDCRSNIIYADRFLSYEYFKEDYGWNIIHANGFF